MHQFYLCACSVFSIFLQKVFVVLLLSRHYSIETLCVCIFPFARSEFAVSVQHGTVDTHNVSKIDCFMYHLSPKVYGAFFFGAAITGVFYLDADKGLLRRPPCSLDLTPYYFYLQGFNMDHLYVPCLPNCWTLILFEVLFYLIISNCNRLRTVFCSERVIFIK